MASTFRRAALRTALCALSLATATTVAQAQLRAGFRSTLAPRGDDTVTPFASFGFGAYIRGETYTSASACMNGYVTLGIPFDPAGCLYPGQSSTPQTLPFLASVHGTAVAVLYRDLNSSNVASGQLGYGSGTVDGRQAFGFTWDGVFTFGSTTASNFFQLIFINRSADFAAGDFDLEYNYGALGPSGGTLAGVGDDGGFSGTPYTAAVTAAANSRQVQCFRNGSVEACGTAVVPEPATVVLTLSGLAGLAGVARRRRRAA